jgi:hypothetical protein
MLRSGEDRLFVATPIVRPFFDAGPDDDIEAFIAEADRHPVFRSASAARTRVAWQGSRAGVGTRPRRRGHAATAGRRGRDAHEPGKRAGGE